MRDSMKPGFGSLQPDMEPILKMGRCPAVRKDDFEPATREEKETFIEIRKSMSYWQDAWRRLKKNRIAMVALGIIILFLLFAFVGPLLSPYSYEQQIRGSENLASSLAHPFGTDGLGRDLLVRVMYGSRISLAVGVVASAIVLVIGSVYGSVSGYVGGRVDDIMMRLVELIYSIPDVLVVLLLSAVLKTPLQQAYNQNQAFRFLGTLGPGLISIFIVFGMLYWVGMARILRGQILQLKQQEFVTAARALGAGRSRIIRRHLLPNCIGQIIVTSMLQIPSAIFLESFLSFLGLGISAPLASLGSLCSDALNGIYTYPLRLVFPAVVLSILILAFNLFGDGLRDALDPRLKQ